MPRLTGKRLNRELALGAEHALYHKDGSWYDQLQKFPGILFDLNGYISFPDLGTYQRCSNLRHPVHQRSDGRPGTLVVPEGISTIPGYISDTRIVSLRGPSA